MKNKTLYPWVLVLLINILIINIVNNYLVIPQPNSYYVIIISLFVTISAVLLSSSRFKYRDEISYWFPILLILPALYSFKIAVSCSGLICVLNIILYASFVGVLGVTYTILYNIGSYFAKR